MDTIEDLKKQNTTLKVISALLGVALIVSLFFVFTGRSDYQDLTTEKAALDAEFKKLTDTMTVRNAEIQQITDHNTELDSIVTARQQELEGKRKEIARLLSNAKMSKKEIAEAKKKIAEYETGIADIQKELEQLKAQNAELTAQNQQLSVDLSSEKQTTSRLSEENKGLSKTVEVGSLLELRNVTIEGVKKRANGRDRAVKKASAAESLKISFETGSNKILPAGPLPLYLRIINPKGETISVADQGSGSFTDSNNGSEIQYSTKADIDYVPTGKKVVVYWSQNINTPGIYKAEVYQTGYLIGSGSVELK